MKVFNLACANGHGFEGWFASEDDHRAQREGGLLACPLCGSTQVERLPSAPRVHLSRTARSVPQSGASDAVSPRVPSAPEAIALRGQVEMQQRFIQAVRQVLERTEDVGDRFPEEARRIHYGESEERGIRGRATRDEAEALAEEGIAVVSIDLPEALKGTTH